MSRGMYKNNNLNYRIMKINIWYGLSLRVILLFFTAMMVSFSPDFLRGFFSDIERGLDEYGRGIIDDRWNWGFRHYLYFWMCMILFIIQAVRLIMWISKNEKEFKP